MHKKRRSSGRPRKVGVPDDSRELLKSILGFMKSEHDLSLSQLAEIYSESAPEHKIPLTIFSGKLSPSEALCRYLKDREDLSFHDIATLLNRDDRSVWTSYSRSKKKQKSLPKTAKDDILLPAVIFTDRSLSILEHIVSHLRSSRNLSNSNIARLLKKNPSAIATVAKRAHAKLAPKKHD